MSQFSPCNKAHNVPYRAAILNAIESLHDFHTRSSTEAIRKYVQSSLPENVAWNSTLFYRTLKDTIQHGDLEQSNASCKLSQELKRKRAEEIATLLTRKLNTYPPPDIQLKYEQKGVPRRHCLHAKPKITPQRILDKAMYVSLSLFLSTD